MLSLHLGASRLVIVTGGIACKFPRGPAGARCNLYEAGIWERNHLHSTRGHHLCPVLWCHPEGKLLVMPAAPLDPASEARLAAMPIDWWDYQPGGDEDPCEPKGD